MNNGTFHLWPIIHKQYKNNTSDLSHFCKIKVQCLAVTVAEDYVTPFYYWASFFTITTLSGLIQQTKIDDSFLSFPRKQDFTFHANCLQSRQFAWNVKSCLLEYFKLFSAEIFLPTYWIIMQGCLHTAFLKNNLNTGKGMPHVGSYSGNSSW